MAKPVDYAIVAGISHYPDPGLGTLDGPENDACAFHEWVMKEAGVSEERTWLIVSSKFKPLAKKPIGAKPDETEVDNAFRELHQMSLEGIKKKKGPRVGRRLYIFLAGHGFMPKWERSVLALLTANAGEGAPMHVAAPLYQDWARDSGAFEEVLLFMDCCGTTGREKDLRPHPFDLVKDPAARANGKIFFAAACKPGLKTREKVQKIGGKSRGVFTLCLLDALSGRAAESGATTSHSLARYLTAHLASFLDDDDQDDDEISKEPYVKFDPMDPFELFGKVTKESTLHEVTLRFGKKDVGKGFELNLGLNPPQLGLTVNAPSMVMRLPTGIWRVEIDGRETSFELPLANGSTDVRV